MVLSSQESGMEVLPSLPGEVDQASMRGLKLPSPLKTQF
jgi:hypothetical protein